MYINVDVTNSLRHNENGAARADVTSAWCPQWIVEHCDSDSHVLCNSCRHEVCTGYHTSSTGRAQVLNNTRTINAQSLSL